MLILPPWLQLTNPLLDDHEVAESSIDCKGMFRHNLLMSQPPPMPLGYANRAACPKCGSQEWAPVGFTWWGGVLGPRMLNHARCALCRSTFNSKTGKSNTTAILIYQGVAIALGLAIGFMVFILR